MAAHGFKTFPHSRPGRRDPGFGGFTVEVVLEGDDLTAIVTDQPPYNLEPYRGTEFRFRELSGYSIRFVPDAGEILVIQPDGVYRGKRKAP